MTMNVTTSSKRLGQLLAESRVQAGLTVRAVAAELGCSAAKITRQEKGTHAVSRAELSFLVKDLYGGDTDVLRPLEWLRQKAEDGDGWWTETGLYMTEHFQTYLGLEADAELIQSVSLEVIPGLLQSEGYIRAQIALADDIDDALCERYAAVRLRRQQRLVDEDNPLRLDLVLSEGALHRAHATPGSDQIEGLIERAQCPNVDIRVLPFTAGQHRVSGSFIILNLPKETIPPVVYNAYAVGGQLIEEPEAVRDTIGIYNTMRDMSLSREDSLEFIREVGKA